MAEALIATASFGLWIRLFNYLDSLEGLKRYKFHGHNHENDHDKASKPCYAVTRNNIWQGVADLTIAFLNVFTLGLMEKQIVGYVEKKLLTDAKTG